MIPLGIGLLASRAGNKDKLAPENLEGLGEGTAAQERQEGAGSRSWGQHKGPRVGPWGEGRRERTAFSEFRIFLGPALS